MCITDLFDAMRPYTAHLLPDNYGGFPDTNNARLTVVPEYVKDAHIIFLLGEETDQRIRVLFWREEGQFEMKYLGFTVKEYVARLESWHQESSEKKRRALEELDKLNYPSGEEFSD